MANKSSECTWVQFLAGANETTLRPMTPGRGGRLSRYRVQQVVPVRGKAPTSLSQGWSAVRIESSVPISLPEESLAPNASSVILLHGVTQHLQYTSDAQRQELNRRSISELEPSDHTTAVLIPIGKSEEWWKLAQDQRQAHFQKTDACQGHTAI